eukprot:TRINITY_DN14996_c0_g1_i1.p1 TRINITY_DN14996_c0_g1~~TRINITY_DN14996_c0_g1_i1.p1  ORF type:complete len:492 (-),score=76.23 TRINITY_DN14996_c0_g1_i1:788-2263(-)
MGQSSSSSLIGHSGRVEPFEVNPEDFSLNLPDECLALVFQKVGKGDRNSCSLVCRRWYFIEAKGRHRLALMAEQSLFSSLPSLTLRFENVTVLALKCSRKLRSIDDKTLTLVGKSFSSLKKIKLKGCLEVTDLGLESFSLVCSPLKKFSCGSCKFGAKGLNAMLRNCSELEDLSVKRLRRLEGESERIVPGQGRLSRICLKDLHNGQIFAPLIAGSHSLRTLILSRNTGYWDHLLDNITETLKLLTELQIENMHVGDRCLMSLSRCSRLEVLYMSKVFDITNFGVAALADGCRKLRKLHMDSSKSRRIGDEGLVAIATKCVQLQEIVLLGIDVSVVTLNALAANCPQLERMALCNSDAIGDEALLCISSKFTGLKKLCIKNCAISDVGLAKLATGCPNLIKLKVKRCREVTSRSVFHLQRSRGALVVSLDHGAETFVEDTKCISHTVEDERVIRSSTHVLCGSRTPFVKSTLSSVASSFIRRSNSSGPSTA